jgi:hypothetical protein
MLSSPHNNLNDKSLLRQTTKENHPKIDYDAQDYQRSCNDLFGEHQLRKFNNGKCLKHNLLNWVSCDIGTISINTDKIEGSVGGEPLKTVMNRPIEVELLNFNSGSLIIKAPLLDKLVLQTGDPIVKSFLRSAILESSDNDSSRTIQNQVTYNVLVRRPTYANPCMAILSMYNVYVVMKYLLGSTESVTNIIWLDGHAQSPNLDAIWKRLFQIKPIYVKKLDESQRIIHNAVVVNTNSAIGDGGLGIYGWEGHNKCKNNTNNSMQGPCLDSTLLQFRNFVIERFGVALKPKDDGTCQLTFLLRNDYMAHPRSNGRTDRTLANAQEEIAYIRSKYPDCEVNPVSFEEMGFEEQLKIVSQSDIFVAVHGAGNIHVLFLPPHALFVEYFPKRFQNRRRFRYLTECLNIKYLSKKAIVQQTFDDEKITVQLHP